MKRNILWSLMLLAAVSLGSVSCGSDDDDEESSGGGGGDSETPAAIQWEGINDDGKPEFITLQKDGTGKIESYNITLDKVSETTDFTYEKLNDKESQFTLDGEVRILRHYTELDKIFVLNEKRGRLFNALNHKVDIKGTWKAANNDFIIFGPNGKGHINEGQEITYQPQNDRRGTYSNDTQTFYYVIIGNQALVYENGYGNKKTALLTKVSEKTTLEPLSLTGHWEGFTNKFEPKMLDIQQNGIGTVYKYDYSTDEKTVDDNFTVEQSTDDPLSVSFIYDKYPKEMFYMNPVNEYIVLKGFAAPKCAYSRKVDIVGEWHQKERIYYFLKDGEALYLSELQGFVTFSYTIEADGRRGIINAKGSPTPFVIIGKWLAWENNVGELFEESRMFTKQ